MFFCYSDGVIRIFSAEPARQADAKTIAKYEEEVSNFGKNVEEEIGGVKVSEWVQLFIVIREILNVPFILHSIMLYVIRLTLWVP